MAKTELSTNVERTFTDDERLLLKTASDIIIDAQSKAEGLAERIAGQLYLVSRKELFRIEDYTSMSDWANDHFDISKGTCSDAINTYDRFGNKDNIGEIDAKYSEYSFSSLISMKKLTDKQIEDYGIKPSMTRATIITIIKKAKEIEDKEKERPMLVREIESMTKIWHKMEEPTVIANFVESIVPGYIDHHQDYTPSIEELQELSEEIDHRLELLEEIDKHYKLLDDRGLEVELQAVKEIVKIDGENRVFAPNDVLERALEYAENSVIKYDHEHYSNNVSSTVEPDETESTEENSESIETENSKEDKPNTMPCYTVDIKDYLKDDGSINKKKILDMIWDTIHRDVYNHHFDMVVTFTE